eukprot:12212306-Alexandrium_andersonii.AAC.1
MPPAEAAAAQPPRSGSWVSASSSARSWAIAASACSTSRRVATFASALCPPLDSVPSRVGGAVGGGLVAAEPAP